MARLSFIHPSDIILAAHTLVVIVIALRVIMMRPATGIALSWLLLVTMLPFAGAIPKVSLEVSGPIEL
jgi:cardiolipin synthase